MVVFGVAVYPFLLTLSWSLVCVARGSRWAPPLPTDSVPCTERQRRCLTLERVLDPLSGKCHRVGARGPCAAGEEFVMATPGRATGTCSSRHLCDDPTRVRLQLDGPCLPAPPSLDSSGWLTCPTTPYSSQVPWLSWRNARGLAECCEPSQCQTLAALPPPDQPPPPPPPPSPPSSLFGAPASPPRSSTRCRIPDFRTRSQAIVDEEYPWPRHPLEEVQFSCDAQEADCYSRGTLLGADGLCHLPLSECVVDSFGRPPVPASGPSSLDETSYGQSYYPPHNYQPPKWPGRGKRQVHPYNATSTFYNAIPEPPTFTPTPAPPGADGWVTARVVALGDGRRALRAQCERPRCPPGRVWATQALFLSVGIDASAAPGGGCVALWALQWDVCAGDDVTFDLFGEAHCTRDLAPWVLTRTPQPSPATPGLCAVGGGIGGGGAVGGGPFGGGGVGDGGRRGLTWPSARPVCPVNDKGVCAKTVLNIPTNPQNTWGPVTPGGGGGVGDGGRRNVIYIGWKHSDCVVKDNGECAQKVVAPNNPDEPNPDLFDPVVSGDGGRRHSSYIPLRSSDCVVEDNGDCAQKVVVKRPPNPDYPDIDDFVSRNI